MSKNNTEELNLRPLKLLYSLCNIVKLDSLMPIPGTEKIISTRKGQPSNNEVIELSDCWAKNATQEVTIGNENKDNKGVTLKKFETCIAQINLTDGEINLKKDVKAFLDRVAEINKSKIVLKENKQEDKENKRDTLLDHVEGFIAKVAPYTSDEYILSYKDIALVIELKCSKTHKTFKLLSLPAKVDKFDRDKRTYELKPNLIYNPQINPQILHNDKKREPELILGTESDYKDALTSMESPNTDDWSIWYQYGVNLLRKTTNKNFQQILNLMNLRLHL